MTAIRPMPIRPRLVLGVSLLLAACGLGSPAQPALAPRFGVALDGRPITAPRLAALPRQFGHRPGVVVVFEQWPEVPPPPAGAPAGLAGLADSLANIAATGATPVVTWEPMYYRSADGQEVILPARSILDGRYDAYIDAFAALLASRPGPVIVRLMHEPNLFRYHWGVTRAAYDARAPGVYQALWRHIVGRARARLGPAAARVQFAFCANAESVPGPGNAADAAWNTIAAYYPGDAWVDLTGVDGYNWGDTQTPARNGWQSSWRSFADVMGPAVAILRALAPAKPLYVFETASAATGGDKVAWLRAAATTAREWKLTALCWFEANKEVDWRLATGVPPTAPADFAGGL